MCYFLYNKKLTYKQPLPKHISSFNSLYPFFSPPNTHQLLRCVKVCQLTYDLISSIFSYQLSNFQVILKLELIHTQAITLTKTQLKTLSHIKAMAHTAYERKL